jgi:hypothetical protein
MSGADARQYLDRALLLIADRRPLLQVVIIITHDRIIERKLKR